MWTYNCSTATLATPHSVEWGKKCFTYKQTTPIHYIHLMAFIPEQAGLAGTRKVNHLDFNEARDDGWQRHQLDHMQIICTSLQTDNHTSTSPLSFYSQMPFLPPNQQCQITEGTFYI